MIVQADLITVVRRQSFASNGDWYFATIGTAALKAFDIDQAETYVYFALSTNPVNVIQVSTSSSSSATAHTQ